VRPKTLDHVAFWVADREPIAEFAVDHLGMHVIDRQESFTLVGSDARHGKLTLFDAEGPREQGAFKHVGLRVSSLEQARRLLPDGTPELFDIGEGIMVRLVEAPTEIEYDLDHVALFTADPDATAREYRAFGFAPSSPGVVEVGGAFVEFHAGDSGEVEQPLLNHVAVLVDSAEEHIEEARKLGIEVESVVDAANTYAAFLWGPDRVRIEYVEHKPSFALK
jgi:catechol 2,3-dioxygenase-like lactoylglutathione lyase family enzyme